MANRIGENPPYINYIYPVLPPVDEVRDPLWEKLALWGVDPVDLIAGETVTFEVPNEEVVEVTNGTGSSFDVGVDADERHMAFSSIDHDIFLVVPIYRGPNDQLIDRMKIELEAQADGNMVVVIREGGRGSNRSCRVLSSDNGNDR